METVFLETNAINSCFDNDFSGIQLANILSTKKLIPIVSQHTTYELAKNFINEENTHKGILLFLILDNLKPTYTCQTNTLLKRQIDNLSVNCDYIIEPYNHKKLKDAFSLIRQNIIDQSFVNFIQERESSITNDQNLWKTLFDYPKIGLFEDFYQEIINNRENIIQIIENKFDKKINLIDAERIISRLTDLKVLKTYFRATLFMIFQAINYKVAPKKDKYDDFRHLIDASLCTYMVTDDLKLRKRARIIIPELKVLSFNELLKYL